MKRALDIILKETLILSKKCIRFIWLLCVAAVEILMNLVTIVSVIAAILILTAIPERIIPYMKLPVNEAELQLIEKNSKALEESFIKNCIASKEYSLNELVPFEWSKVYFIEAEGDVDPFNPAHGYNTDAKKIRKKAGYDWGGRIPDMVDVSGLGSYRDHTHILFKNGRKVTAYLPYNLRSEPTIIRLHYWAEGEFMSSDNPTFFIDIIDDDSGNRSFVLTP